MTGWARRRELADSEWRMERDQAETIACPEPSCGAAVGEHCRNINDGGPLERLPAHGKRIKDADSRPASGPYEPNGGAADHEPQRTD